MWKKWLLVALLVLIGILLIPYSLPIIFAGLTALLLDGAVSAIQRYWKWRRLYAVLVIFLLYIASLAAAASFLINTIFKQMVILAQKTPAFAQEFYHSTLIPLIDEGKRYAETLPGEVLLSAERALERSINSLDSLAQGLIQKVFGVVTVVPGFMLEFLIYMVALFLISLELPRLKEKAQSYLTPSTSRKVQLVTSQLTSAGVGFLKAQVILSALTFLMAAAGLWFLGVPYIALLSLLIVLVDILPILGTGSVLVPWAIVALLRDNQTLGIGLLVMFVVITVVRRTVEPKIYSQHMGISPLAALVSLYIGFKLLGFVGLFAGPALVILYETLKNADVIHIRFKL
ncbi:sporulation integral membrane protein YtvI [Ectobacillus ponti]|uniref:Sporulation integral membrane protein YtvI n=1 Tax=Ectobacillus ponti TaxID=2961894 RepID=A0AA41X9P7_9BACI|nr:sporulation integral membrane protein YtvI [Ectobacillus ponti]MCP8969470.1 sporulation integral membrane protein YtvI [Ectobacillus ponti]